MSAVTSSSITVQWDPIPCLEWNGDIVGHTVQYGVVGGVGMETILVAGNETLAQLSGLVSSTEYWIQVAAVNNVGTGEFSSSITQGTEGKYTQTLQAGNCHSKHRGITSSYSYPTHHLSYHFKPSMW